MFSKFFYIWIVGSVVGAVAAQGGLDLGGGNPPPSGWFDLNEDWVYKLEYSGTTKIVSWTMENGVPKKIENTYSWPLFFDLDATNGTPYHCLAYKEEEGDIKIKVKWRHGGNPAPPPTLRLWMSSGINVSTTDFADRGEIDSGLGILKQSGPGWHYWSTPGKVLRKIAINGTGEGEKTIHQRLYADADSPRQTCSTVGPGIHFGVDTRTLTITTVDGGWPKVKGGEIRSYAEPFKLPQDDYKWFEHFHDVRKFTYTLDLGKPAPVLFPSDVGDESEWHLGLPADLQVIPSYAPGTPVNRVYTSAGYEGIVIGAESGNLFEWSGLITRSGTYVDESAFFHTFQHLRPVTVDAGSLNRVYTIPGEESVDYSVNFTWTWADGLVGQSRRKIKFHINAEPDGQKSAKWVDCKVGEGYETSDFEPQSTTHPGWTPRNTSTAKIIHHRRYTKAIEVLGPIFSGGGPFGAIVMAGVGLQGASLVIAFASIELAGALLDLIPNEDESHDMPRSTWNVQQCDSLKVKPGLLCDTNEDGILDGIVEEADYRDYSKLVGLKAAMNYPTFDLQDYRWKMSHRLRENFWYERYDQWNLQGYRGGNSRRHSEEDDLRVAFYYMEFAKDSVGGGD